MTVLAQGLTSPSALVVDAENVYWTDIGTGDNAQIANTILGSIWEAPLSGGPSVELATPECAPSAIAQDATSIYWATDYGCYLADAGFDFGGIWKAAKDGGGVTQLYAPFTANDDVQFEADGIAVTGGAVFWPDHGESGAPGGLVDTLSVNGGPASVFVPLPENWVSDGPANGRQLTTDGSRLYGWGYFTPTDGGNSTYCLWWANLSDGNSLTVIASNLSPGAFALDTHDIFWIDGTSVLWRVPISGGAPLALSTSDFGSQVFSGFNSQIAVDASNVYLTDSVANEVWVTDKDGGSLVQLTPQVNDRTDGIAVTVDATSVYWTGAETTNFGTVSRYAPK